MADDDSLPPALRFPDSADQDRLLSALRRLVESQGYLTLVRAPILDSSPSWFPDAYPPGACGVRTLARRLLAYCGLDGRRVVLRVAREASYAEFSPEGRGRWGGGAAAWFEGIDESTCRFGINAAELRDPVAVVGSLCHEVAHAWRADHRIVAMDPGAEELATDLTAVYLGFGIHLLNSSATFRTGHFSDTGEALAFEHTARGYLSPGQIALLLAAQVVARDAPTSERKRISRALSANQRVLFERACEALQDDPVELRARIGVPEPPWAEGVPLAALTAPLPADDVDEEPDVEAPGVGPSDRGSALRVTHSRAGLLAVLGAVVPLLGALVIHEFRGLALTGSIVGAAVAGGAVGFFLRTSTCSACQTRVGRADERCPACGAWLSDHPETGDGEEPAPPSAGGGDGAGDRVRCPGCGWAPKADSWWQCRCGHRWNTFVTHGICPECGEVWLTTTCPSCRLKSPHGEWYGPSARAET